LADMLRFAMDFAGPVALRYPRGTAYEGFREYRAPIKYGCCEAIYEEDGIAILAVGHMFETAVSVRTELKEIGYNCSLINSRFVKPLDEKALEALAKDHKLIVTIEENVASGGFGERVAQYILRRQIEIQVLNITLPDEYVEHGSVDVLRREVMLDAQSIVKRVITAYAGSEKV